MANENKSLSTTDKNIPEVNKLGHIAARDIMLDIPSGMEMIQTAQMSASQIAEILGHMRSLAEQTAAGNLGDPAIITLANDFKMLSNEIDRIANDTVFNNVHLFNGAVGSITISNGTIGLFVHLTDLTTEPLGLNLQKQYIDNTADAQIALPALQNAIEKINDVINKLDMDEITLEKLLHHSSDEMDIMVGMIQAVETSSQAKILMLDMSQLALLSQVAAEEAVLNLLKSIK